MHALVVARRWQNAFLPGVLRARAGARAARRSGKCALPRSWVIQALCAVR